MKCRLWLFSFVVLLTFTCVPAWALELKPLADCSAKIFNEINRTGIWSGKSPAGCRANFHVEQRPSGIFVTVWNSTNSGQEWEQLTFSAAMGLSEIGKKKSLKKAVQDIGARAVRLERCLNSILRVNDPLECRDYATKSYVAGETAGIEFERKIWLDDNGRHTVVGYSHGDSSAVVSAPADLFGGAALPPGTKLNIHIVDTP